MAARAKVRPKVRKVAKKVQQRHGGTLTQKQANQRARRIISNRPSSGTTKRRATTKRKTNTKGKGTGSSQTKDKKVPQSSELKTARQALIASELLAMEADRDRLADISKGTYSGVRKLRAAGSAISSRYRIGKLKADKGYGKKKTAAKGTGKKKVVAPKKRAKVAKKVQQRHGGKLTQKQANLKARQILIKRGKYKTVSGKATGAKGKGRGTPDPEDRITGAKPGTNKYKLQTSGGTYKDLELWRRLSYWDRRRLLRKRRDQGRNLTNMVRDRFDRGPEYED